MRGASRRDRGAAGGGAKRGVRDGAPAAGPRCAREPSGAAGHGHRGHRSPGTVTHPVSHRAHRRRPSSSLDARRARGSVVRGPVPPGALLQAMGGDAAHRVLKSSTRGTGRGAPDRDRRPRRRHRRGRGVAGSVPLLTPLPARVRGHTPLVPGPWPGAPRRGSPRPARSGHPPRGTDQTWRPTGPPLSARAGGDPGRGDADTMPAGG